MERRTQRRLFNVPSHGIGLGSYVCKLTTSDVIPSILNPVHSVMGDIGLVMHIPVHSQSLCLSITNWLLLACPISRKAPNLGKNNMWTPFAGNLISRPGRLSFPCLQICCQGLLNMIAPQKCHCHPRRQISCQSEKIDFYY